MEGTIYALSTYEPRGVSYLRYGQKASHQDGLRAIDNSYCLFKWLYCTPAIPISIHNYFSTFEPKNPLNDFPPPPNKILRRRSTMTGRVPLTEIRLLDQCREGRRTGCAYRLNLRLICSGGIFDLKDGFVGSDEFLIRIAFVVKGTFFRKFPIHIANDFRYDFRTIL
jgi:hypothetical protein